MIKQFNCKGCGTSFEALYKRTRPRAFCSLKCAGAFRVLPLQAKKEAKRLYDVEYRQRNYEAMKGKKREYHLKTYDPIAARTFRSENKEEIKAYKTDYYAKAENKEHKKDYDRARRCKLKFGEFWEAASICIDLEAEIHKRMERFEIYKINGTLNKIISRRRAYERAKRQEFEGIALGNPK